MPFALFACGLLTYGAAFAWHMLTSFDLVDHIGDVNYDEAFYYFQIAYNLSQGKFSTFDGGITQTNGYHPRLVAAHHALLLAIRQRNGAVRHKGV